MALSGCITSPVNASTSGKLDQYHGLLKTTLKATGRFKHWDRHLSQWLPSQLTSDLANWADPAQQKVFCVAITRSVGTKIYYFYSFDSHWNCCISRVLREISINLMTYFQRRYLKYIVAKPKNFAVSILLFLWRKVDSNKWKKLYLIDQEMLIIRSFPGFCPSAAIYPSENHLHTTFQNVKAVDQQLEYFCIV